MHTLSLRNLLMMISHCLTSYMTTACKVVTFFVFFFKYYSLMIFIFHCRFEREKDLFSFLIKISLTKTNGFYLLKLTAYISCYGIFSVEWWINLFL